MNKLRVKLKYLQKKLICEIMNFIRCYLLCSHIDIILLMYILMYIYIYYLYYLYYYIYITYVYTYVYTYVLYLCMYIIASEDA